MTTIRAFFSTNLDTFLQFLKKGRGDLPPPPSSYAPVEDTHWEKAPSNKTLTHSKSMKSMNLSDSYIKSTLYKLVLKLK